MDQNLPWLYKDYGVYSNFRNFPMDIDGLKPVERRALFSAYKIARQKFVKSRQVDSYTTGHFHPHGEVYGTIVQLVRQGFLIGQGNFGSTVGIDITGPAAPRYTECKMNPRTVDLAFKYLDHVPWQETELNDTEPLFLPSMFPLCLIGEEYTQGIGFGFKTYIPYYSTKDLHQRLLWKLGIRKRKPIIAPMTDCNILSDKDTLEELLTTGKGRIEVQGVIDVNKTANTAVLKSWPPGNRFASILKKFEKEMNEGMIGFRDTSSGKNTAILFQVLRERNRDKIFEAFLEKLIDAVTGFISFEVVVVDKDWKVLTKSIDDMIVDTYKMFHDVNQKMLHYEIENLDENINEYNDLAKIRPSIIKGINSKLEMEKLLLVVEKETNVKKERVKELIGKYRISKLITLDTDTKEFLRQKEEVKKILSNIDEFVLEQYNVL